MRRMQEDVTSQRTTHVVFSRWTLIVFVFLRNCLLAVWATDLFALVVCNACVFSFCFCCFLLAYLHQLMLTGLHNVLA